MSAAFRALSAAAVLFCLLAVVGTPPPAGAPGETVYVLDVSRSHGPAPAQLRERLRQWHERHAPGASEARVIFAAATAEDEPVARAGWTDGSRIDLGLERALRSRGGARRVVVLSDGRFDHEAAARQVRALEEAGVLVSFAGPLAQPALDMRLVPRGDAPVEGGRARVRIGVTGTNREPARVRLAVPGIEPPVAGTIVVAPGAVEEWEVLVPVAAGQRAVEVRLERDEGPDAAPGNDQASVTLRRVARTAVVLGDDSDARLVSRILEDSGFEIASPSSLLPSDLECDLVVLSNRPASKLPVGDLVKAVTEHGVGLWAIGGRSAFGNGGYAGTALDDLLPLSSRAAEPRAVTLVLDTSGSMENENRLARAVEAVENLAKGLGPDDRLQVVPFAEEPGRPNPAEPAAPAAFLADALPELRRIAARGGTRLLPVLDAVLARPSAGAAKRVLVVVSDARDDHVTPAELVARAAELRRGKIDALFVLLDPASETRERARALTANVVEAADVSPRLLLDVVERESFVAGPAATVLADGSPGPAIAWRNRVRPGKDAEVLLRTADGDALMATAFRGVGRTAAWAAFPASEAQAAAMAREWAARAARPAGWEAASARREPGRIVVTLPPGDVPAGPLGLRIPGLSADLPLAERTPGVFEAEGVSAVGGSAAVVSGDRVVAAVPVPDAGDPEYAWPAILPAGGGEPPPAAPPGRRRALWAALAALAWAGALVARSRRA